MATIRQNLKWWLILFLVLTNGLIYFAIARSGEHPLVVVFLNVGQGDSIYIEGPNGNQIILDGGSNAAVLRELGKVMPFFDHTIDLVIESHPDQDHIGGLTDVFSRYQVLNFMEPGIPNDTGATVALLRAVDHEKGVKRYFARRDMVVDLGSGTRLRILFPDQDVSNFETNRGSIVAHLEYGKTSVLLTGDSPIVTEQHLLFLNKGELKSDILKLGHHGSRTSSSVTYVEAVAPTLAIISAGKNNRYGHPHKEVLDILAALHIPSVSTAIDGTLVYQSDGVAFTRK